MINIILYALICFLLGPIATSLLLTMAGVEEIIWHFFAGMPWGVLFTVLLANWDG